MKLAILGPGLLAGKVAPTLKALPEIECYAVASRSLSRSQAFAEAHGFEKAYGSYEAMLSDPQVELVYITTPHSHHYAQIKLCLQYGKHVICEKAFTINASQAREVFALAAEKGLYVAEAIWTRYMPGRQILQDILDGGIIGPVHMISANLSYNVTYKPRILDPNLAGGALLDVGIYGLNFALMHAGASLSGVDSSVQLAPTGVDAAETITLHFENGVMACLNHCICARSDRTGVFHGEKGYILVDNINNPQVIRVFDDADNLLGTHQVPPQISGYEYQFQEAAAQIRAGKTESLSMPAAETIAVLALMDRLRGQWGLVYPMER